MVNSRLFPSLYKAPSMPMFNSIMDFDLRDWFEAMGIDTRSVDLPSIKSEGPRMNIREENDHYIAEFEVPGFAESDLDLALQDNQITLTGKRESATEENERYLCKETKIFKFTRSYEFAEPVTEDGVEASLRNGILTVIVPKSDKVKPHKITIK